MIVLCSYCFKPAALVTGKEIYPHRPELYTLKFWECAACQAYVGCHKASCGQGDGTKPLGRLANAKLRAAKSLAHKMFDPIWKTKAIKRQAFDAPRCKPLKRKDAYKWLASMLGIAVDECHIGMFNVEQCQNVANLCRALNSKSALTNDSNNLAYFINGPKERTTLLMPITKRFVTQGVIYERVFSGYKSTAAYKVVQS